MSYSDLLEYLKGRTGSHLYKVSRLAAIRYYYRYLKHIGLIAENPASGLYLRGRKTTVPHDLLSGGQLETLYESCPSGGLAGKLNKALLGILIYQGMGTGEVSRLEPCHLHVREGKVEIPGSRRTNGRILNLEARQLLDLQEYTLQVRHKIQALTGKPSPYLFISLGQGDSLRNSLENLIGNLQKQHDWLRNARQIRRSRISLWVKQYDIRQVQYMAGHKYVSSTERYQSTNLEDLHKELEKLHPLG